MSDWSPSISQEEFTKRYCQLSSIDIPTFNKYKIVLPCNCKEGMCEGWAAILKDYDLICAHTEFSAPSSLEYLKWINKERK